MLVAGVPSGGDALDGGGGAGVVGGDGRGCAAVQVVGAALGVDLRFPASGQSSRHGSEDGCGPKCGEAPCPGGVRLQETERREKWWPILILPLFSLSPLFSFLSFSLSP